MSERPSHGDTTGEYLALRSGAGLVRPGGDVVWVEGTDAVTFLDGQLSQDIAAISGGATARSFLLEPRGKVRALLRVLVGEDRVGLVVDRGLAGRVIEDLDRFRFRVDAALRIDERETVEVWGPAAAEVVQRAGLPVPPGWSDDGSGLVAGVPLPGLPRFLVAGVDPGDVERAGARLVGSVAAGSVRIEAGEPVMGVDIDDDTIPQETGLVDEAVSFTKGCYVGQELVARIDARGHVNRRLRGMVLDENLIPPVGAGLWLEGEPVGVLGSVGESLSLRAPVALAMVRREAAPGSRVGVRWEGGETSATVREVPLDDFSSP